MNVFGISSVAKVVRTFDMVPNQPNVLTLSAMSATRLDPKEHGAYTGQPQWLATIPLLLSAVMLRMVVQHPKYLKQMGWSLLAVNVLSGVLQVGIRLG